MQEFNPGNLIEIGLGDDLVYAIVTHDHPSYPTVVRGLKGRHGTRPDDTGQLAQGETAFTVMIPLGSVLRKLDLPHEVVGTVDLSGTSFPTFRMPIRDKQGNIVYWWFWDGRGLSYEVELSPEQSEMPMREIPSAERFLDLLKTAAA